MRRHLVWLAQNAVYWLLNAINKTTTAIFATTVRPYWVVNTASTSVSIDQGVGDVTALTDGTGAGTMTVPSANIAAGEDYFRIAE